MSLIEKARAFSVEAHKGQLYNDLPYSTHTDAVAFWARHLDGSDEAIAAAHLHDTVEDTPTTLEDIRSLFGADVADIVDAVTDGLEGNRAARKARCWPLIRKNADAFIVKVADRISNIRFSMENCVGDSPNSRKCRRMLKMYMKEHQAFVDALAPSYRRYHEEWMILSIQRSTIKEEGLANG